MYVGMGRGSRWKGGDFVGGIESEEEREIRMGGVCGVVGREIDRWSERGREYGGRGRGRGGWGSHPRGPAQCLRHCRRSQAEGACIMQAAVAQTTRLVSQPGVEHRQQGILPKPLATASCRVNAAGAAGEHRGRAGRPEQGLGQRASNGPRGVHGRQMRADVGLKAEPAEPAEPDWTESDVLTRPHKPGSEDEHGRPE